MLATILDPTQVRDIAPLALDGDGRPKVVPAEVFRNTTRLERAVFGVRHALYGFLTSELVEFLGNVIGGQSAIEIGAGHGELARALGIPATDNRQQEDPAIQAHYARLHQPVIRYGANVEKLAAAQAVAKYRPKVVVASWVTHRYDPRRHEAGGNQNGVIEEDIVRACEAYVLIGNEAVHAAKSVWDLPHVIHYPSWLYSRAYNSSPDFIAIWRNPS